MSYEAVLVMRKILTLVCCVGMSVLPRAARAEASTDVLPRGAGANEAAGDLPRPAPNHASRTAPKKAPLTPAQRQQLQSRARWAELAGFAGVLSGLVVIGTATAKVITVEEYGEKNVYRRGPDLAAFALGAPLAFLGTLRPDGVPTDYKRVAALAFGGLYLLYNISLPILIDRGVVNINSGNLHNGAILMGGTLGIMSLWLLSADAFGVATYLRAQAEPPAAAAASSGVKQWLPHLGLIQDTERRLLPTVSISAVF